MLLLLASTHVHLLRLLLMVRLLLRSSVLLLSLSLLLWLLTASRIRVLLLLVLLSRRWSPSLVVLWQLLALALNLSLAAYDAGRRPVSSGSSSSRSRRDSHMLRLLKTGSMRLLLLHRKRARGQDVGQVRLGSMEDGRRLDRRQRGCAQRPLSWRRRKGDRRRAAAAARLLQATQGVRSEARAGGERDTHSLDDGGVSECRRGGRRVIDQKVLDVTGAKDDVLVHLVARCDRLVRHSILRPKGAHCVCVGGWQ